MVADPRWKENQEVSRAASGSVNELVPALSRIVESGNWREFIQPRGDIFTFNTFAAYCDGWLKISPEAVLVLLDRTQHQHAAELVRKAIREGAEPRGAHGGDRKSGEYQGDTITLITEDRGTDPSYLLGRLKRDHPELAGEVVEGTITVRAAAIKVGILHPRIYVRADDPGSAIRSLLKHYTRTQLLETLNQLPAEETPND